jgi:polar amino acid transport system substrate-binding protein
MAGAVLSACGASTSKPSADAGSANCTVTTASSSAADPAPFSGTIATDAAAIAKLPASVKAKGSITLASDATYAPNEFTSGSDSSTIIGLDADLAHAVGKVLGITVNVTNASFDSIIAGIQGGRYDGGISSMTDTKEREQTVDFVTYYTAGTATVVQKCNPKNIKTDLDLCGKNVAAETGSTQIDMLTKADAGSVLAECTKAGKAAPVAKSLPDQNGVNSALQAGRVDAYLADSPVADYAIRQTGVFEKVGSDAGVAPYGLALSKSAGTLKDAIEAAFNVLIQNGTYTKILTNWGVQSGAVTSASINGATS